jgi:hypothetical protein
VVLVVPDADLFMVTRLEVIQSQGCACRLHDQASSQVLVKPRVVM